MDRLDLKRCWIWFLALSCGIQQGSLYALPQTEEIQSASRSLASDFELKAPGLERPSRATLTDEELAIRSPDGSVSRYKRLPRYDTSDGAFLSYSSRELQQIIRWPVSGTGGMQIGTLQQGASNLFLVV